MSHLYQNEYYIDHWKAQFGDGNSISSNSSYEEHNYSSTQHLMMTIVKKGNYFS